MKTIELIKALKEQMIFCERENNYKCGVYITTEANKDIVMKVLDNLLPVINRNVEVRNNSYESFIRYPNGNMIRVVRANSSAREQRFNGVIIDSNINQETIYTTILPCLIPKLENGIYSSNDNPRDREYHCSISREDVIESEKHKQLVFISSAMNKQLYKYQRDILDSMLYGIRFKNNNYIKFKKQIKGLFHDRKEKYKI